ncbi:hypothetical protein SCUCBS95973_008100 [Sporothrix curviconia]|uniref:Zn(2)-C6 fungal-type domain-containing protein n=1 Tax=Sporothrix curviconia TaxID=1260050 RepID=A0ABP0CK22_9PEZI
MTTVSVTENAPATNGTNGALPARTHKRPLRTAGASGGFSDRQRAIRDLAALNIDVIVGDWLSECTMTLHGAQKVDNERLRAEGKLLEEPVGLFDPTFMENLSPALPDIARKGIKVAVNAGASDTQLLARQVQAEINRQGLGLKVAYVEGDEVTDTVNRLIKADEPFPSLMTGEPLSDWGYTLLYAQCYMGGAGIAQALREGSAIVICGCVADAAPSVGTGMWWHGWDRGTDFDEIAGSLVCGHLIECAAYVTGGYFSGFKRLLDKCENLGFPIAELAHDGSCVITKEQNNTGGEASVGTGPLYYGSDVTACLEGVVMTQIGPDRVQVTGVRGLPPPRTTKVGLTAVGGYQAEFHVYLCGIDLEAKAEWVERQIRYSAGDAVKELSCFKFSLNGYCPDNPRNQDVATVDLRIFVQTQNKALVSKATLDVPSFNRWCMDNRLQGCPGWTLGNDQRQSEGKLYYEYYVTLLAQAEVKHHVVLPWDSHRTIDVRPVDYPHDQRSYETAGPVDVKSFGPTTRGPLGWVVGGRSGDKASDANVGLFVRHDDEWDWLRLLLTVDKIKHLLDEEYKGGVIERFEIPGIRAVHFLLRDHLDRGFNSTSTYDTLGKNVGEFLISATPARHRSRASAACLACRKARIRCVANQPDNACINCKDNGYECQFDAKDGRKERASAKAVTESLTKRVHQLEELLRATQPLTSGPGAASQDSYRNSLRPSSASTLPINSSLSAAAGCQSSIMTLDFALSMPMLDDSATTTEADAYIDAVLHTPPSIRSPCSSPASAFASASASTSTAVVSEPATTAEPSATVTAAPVPISTSAPADQPAVKGSNALDIPTIIRPQPFSAKDADTPDTTTDTASVVCSLVPSPIRFDMSSGRVRYFGPTTNMNVLTHIAPDAGVVGRGQPAVHWPICLVVRDLSPDTHDYLMEQYWTCYNSVLHLIHSDAFNHDLDRGGTQFYSLFLHLAMLATGFRFADKSRADVQRLAMAPGSRFGSTLHEKAVALAKLEFDRPGGIPSIQAFGLLADVEFTIGRDESGWLFSGMSLRLVIDVGLHVDPSPLQLMVKEAQIRHMVLWACILHDMYWALYLGRPITLKPVDIAPACLSNDFTRLICCRPSGHEKKLTTRIYEHLLQLMDLISPLCDRSTLARPTRTTEAYFKMVALDEDLHGWYEDLPDDLKWPTARPNMPSSYFLLHTQYHAALILLHRPFVQYRAGAGAGAGAGADTRPGADNTFVNDDAAGAEVPAAAGNKRSRFTSLSRPICAEHTGHIVSLFQEYRSQFDVSRVFGTGLSHLGTAATTLMGEAVLDMDRAKRGVIIVQLMSLRRSINLMSGNYPPGRHMTRILDQFIDAVRQQQREGTPPPPPPLPLPQSCGNYSSANAARRNHNQRQRQQPTIAGRHSSSAGVDGSLTVPKQQQPHLAAQQAYARPAAGTSNDTSPNSQYGYDNNGYAQQPAAAGSSHARKRQRTGGNPCTFTPTVPASPTLQGLPFMPSSFLESLDASDLVIFPETTGYSDYGFDWDPADMSPI